MVNVRWGVLVAIVCLLSAGCSGSPEPCPPPVPVDLTGGEEFAEDPSLPFQFPLADYPAEGKGFVGGFGAGGSELAYAGKYHAAEDVARPAYTPVYAMADGRISFSGTAGGYGWLIIIDHPEANLYSLYGHLSSSRWHAEEGPVSKGDLIAYLGDMEENGSDATYGYFPPHLHFGVRAGQRLDYPGSGE